MKPVEVYESDFCGIDGNKRPSAKWRRASKRKQKKRLARLLNKAFKVAAVDQSLAATSSGDSR